MSDRPALRRSCRILGSLAAGLVLVLAAAPASFGSSWRFPVPSCQWASASLVGRTLGIRVRALSPVWSTSVAPVLSCGYVERQPHLQFGNAQIVTIQFRELQRFKVKRGYKSVRGLGSCIKRSSCPGRGGPAWISQATTFPTGPDAEDFVSALSLGVEDGLNALIIQVDNPDGPLPVAHEAAQVEKLARGLLPRFLWR